MDSFKNIWDSMPVSSWVVGPDGVITSWNKMAEEITGISAEQAVGRPSSEIFLCRRNTGDLGLGIVPACDDRELCEIQGKGNRRIFLIKTSRPVFDQDGNPAGWVESGIDISEAHLDREIFRFQSEPDKPKGVDRIIGRHPLMLEVYHRIKLAADSNVSVIITGESGTGKELVAEAIHRNSVRSKKNFVKVNCSAIPETLLESELFGHVKGSFTGANYDKKGRFEYADGGTIFLDEIGDISLQIQAKLLRVLQDKTFERVGESTPTTTDVRIICATNRDLTSLVNRNFFREDLFYRINVFPVKMPPLRARSSDIPLLVKHFIEKIGKDTGRQISGISTDAMTLLKRFPWPGNVRQLENAIEHAFVTARGGLISVFDLPQELREEIILDDGGLGPDSKSQPQKQRDEILAALRQCEWNRTKAARILGISRVTLWKRIKELGLLNEQT